MALVLIFSVIANAQQKEVTKFLGIPVDGTKSAMIEKLKAKGFVYSAKQQCLKGEFNGTNVNVYVVTRNNKVWRIMVSDEYTMSETDIKIRFNKLCNLFDNNKKYANPDMLRLVMNTMFSIYDAEKAKDCISEAKEFKGYTIPEDEDISYNMSVKNKRYEASYYQIQDQLDKLQAQAQDSIETRRKFTKWMNENYTEAEIKGLSEDDLMKLSVIYMQSMFKNMVEEVSNRSVWFMISKDNYSYDTYRPYRILMYYDNSYNNNEGADL